MSLPQKPARPARTPPPRPAEVARSPESPQADAAGAGRFYLLIGAGVAGLLGVSVLLGVVIGSAMRGSEDNGGTGQASLPTPPKMDSAARELEAEREARRQREEAERQAARERLQQAAQNVGDSPPVRDGAAASRGGALADLQRADRPRVGGNPLLELPARDFSLTGPRGAVMLAKIYATSVQECDLSLAGSEIALGSGRQFRLRHRDEGGARIWDVETFTPNGLNNPSVGTFRLSGEAPEFELSFAWTSGADGGADGQMLRYCLLNVRVQEDAATCALAAPERVENVRLDLNNRMHREPVEVEIPRTADEHVRLDLWFEPGELPIRTTASDRASLHPEPMAGRVEKRALAVGGDRPLFQVLLGEEEGGGPGQRSSRFRCVALNVGFKREGDRLQVQLETLLFPRGLKWNRGTPPSYQFLESQSGEVWNRGKFEEHRANALKERAPLKDEKVLRAFNDEVKKRASQVAELERIQSRDQLPGAQGELDRWKRARDDHDRAIKFTEEAETWCEEMLDFFGRIESELRIGYRVYIVVEGQEIELVRAVDGPAAANAQETR